jgi:TRAP-type C4-dicarboxylate transport system substrate-binding protein
MEEGMTRLTRWLVGVMVVIVAAMTTLPAQAPVAIKLATILPTNSLWHDALRTLGDNWRKDTGGRVTLQLFTGGIRGTEPTYLRMMGIDDIQAALLLPPGLSEIDPAFNVLGMPFFFASDEEAFAVLEQLTPVLSRRLEARRFHLVNWGSGGWVQIFSKQPIRTIDDLKRGQLYTTEGDSRRGPRTSRARAP